MSGQMKLKGDVQKAMALDRLMGQMKSRGFHTDANNNGASMILQPFKLKKFSFNSSIPVLT